MPKGSQMTILKQCIEKTSSRHDCCALIVNDVMHQKKMHEISQEYATINSTQNPYERLSDRGQVLCELVMWHLILQIVSWSPKGHSSISLPVIRLEVEE